MPGICGVHTYALPVIMTLFYEYLAEGHAIAPGMSAENFVLKGSFNMRVFHRSYCHYFIGVFIHLRPRVVWHQRKEKGASTETCGTPDGTGFRELFILSTQTD